MTKNKHILIGVLNWGMGHATRMVPVIKALAARGHQITIASDGYPLEYLGSLFPNATTLELPSYSVTYGDSDSQIWPMIQHLPGINKAIQAEQKVIIDYMDQHAIDLTISDNRYGVRHLATPSILITHQLFIPFPKPDHVLNPIVQWGNHRLMSKFDRIWIPDLAPPNSIIPLLTNTDVKKPVEYVGILSRFFSGGWTADLLKHKYDLTAVLSGPEPQRSILEAHIRNLANQLNKTCLLIRGVKGTDEIRQTDSLIWEADFMGTDQLAPLYLSANYLIVRAGYSTIMDLITLGKSALLIPTPGQSEQEYIGAEMHQRGWFVTIQQRELENLAQLPHLSIEKPGLFNSSGLETAIDRLFT